jgi:hypothetical protein
MFRRRNPSDSLIQELRLTMLPQLLVLLADLLTLHPIFFRRTQSRLVSHELTSGVLLSGPSSRRILGPLRTRISSRSSPQNLRKDDGL